jgi:hypothetical protein
MATRERHCPVCGESLGVLSQAQWERGDTCGKLKCEREVRAAEAAEREEARRQLDEERGW